MCRKRGGFTLIELLVVVAIISILAGILMPAFSSSRERGRRAVCLANQHQITLAFFGMAQDHNEQFSARTTNELFQVNTRYVAFGQDYSFDYRAYLDPYIDDGRDGSAACSSDSEPSTMPSIWTFTGHSPSAIRPVNSSARFPTAYPPGPAGTARPE